MYEHRFTELHHYMKKIHFKLFYIGMISLTEAIKVESF